jgi:hypothetical protein
VAQLRHLQRNSSSSNLLATLSWEAPRT